MTKVLFRYLIPVIFILLPEILRAHEPVALEKIPVAVINAVRERVPGFEISRAEVDEEKDIPVYVIKGSSGDKELAVEVLPSGIVLQTYDRKYYEEKIED